MPNLDVTEYGKWFFGESWTMKRKPGKTLVATSGLAPNFNGWGIPPSSPQHVQELIDYYVHGNPSKSAPKLPVDQDTMERGHPIDGDETARWAKCPEATYGDIPHMTPRWALF